jgi:pimeloyl-ACP methyl ester carboxylesterase
VEKLPIVLQHGAGGSYEATFVGNGWANAIEAAGRTPIGVQLPGHSSPQASRNPADYRDLAAMLEPALPGGRFDAIGFSLGAKLLLELALRFPARIGRMVLGGVGDNVFAPESVAPAVAEALEHGPNAGTPPPVLVFLKTWNRGSTDPLALAAVMRRPANPVFSPERLAQIRVPVLVVNGELDPVRTLGGRMLAALTDCQSLTVPGTAHFDLPANRLFMAAALSFLNRNGTAGAADPRLTEVTP